MIPPLFIVPEVSVIGYISAKLRIRNNLLLSDEMLGTKDPSWPGRNNNTILTQFLHRTKLSPIILLLLRMWSNSMVVVQFQFHGCGVIPRKLMVVKIDNILSFWQKIVILASYMTGIFVNKLEGHLSPHQTYHSHIWSEYLWTNFWFSVKCWMVLGEHPFQTNL